MKKVRLGTDRYNSTICTPREKVRLGTQPFRVYLSVPAVPDTGESLND